MYQCNNNNNNNRMFINKPRPINSKYNNRWIQQHSFDNVIMTGRLTLNKECDSDKLIIKGDVKV